MNGDDDLLGVWDKIVTGPPKPYGTLGYTGAATGSMLGAFAQTAFVDLPLGVINLVRKPWYESMGLAHEFEPVDVDVRKLALGKEYQHRLEATEGPVLGAMRRIGEIGGTAAGFIGPKGAFGLLSPGRAIQAFGKIGPLTPLAKSGASYLRQQMVKKLGRELTEAELGALAGKATQREFMKGADSALKRMVKDPDTGKMFWSPDIVNAHKLLVDAGVRNKSLTFRLAEAGTRIGPGIVEAVQGFAAEAFLRGGVPGERGQLGYSLEERLSAAYHSALMAPLFTVVGAMGGRFGQGLIRKRGWNPATAGWAAGAFEGLGFSLFETELLLGGLRGLVEGDTEALGAWLEQAAGSMLGFGFMKGMRAKDMLRERMMLPEDYGPDDVSMRAFRGARNPAEMWLADFKATEAREGEDLYVVRGPARDRFLIKYSKPKETRGEEEPTREDAPRAGEAARAPEEGKEARERRGEEAERDRPAEAPPEVLTVVVGKGEAQRVLRDKAALEFLERKASESRQAAIRGQSLRQLGLQPEGLFTGIYRTLPTAPTEDFMGSLVGRYRVRYDHRGQAWQQRVDGKDGGRWHKVTLETPQEAEAFLEREWGVDPGKVLPTPTRGELPEHADPRTADPIMRRVEAKKALKELQDIWGEWLDDMTERGLFPAEDSHRAEWDLILERSGEWLDPDSSPQVYQELVGALSHPEVLATSQYALSAPPDAARLIARAIAKNFGMISSGRWNADKAVEHLPMWAARLGAAELEGRFEGDVAWRRQPKLLEEAPEEPEVAPESKPAKVEPEAAPAEKPPEPPTRRQELEAMKVPELKAQVRKLGISPRSHLKKKAQMVEAIEAAEEQIARREQARNVARLQQIIEEHGPEAAATARAMGFSEVAEKLELFGEKHTLARLIDRAVYAGDEAFERIRKRHEGTAMMGLDPQSVKDAGIWVAAQMMKIGRWGPRHVKKLLKQAGLVSTDSEKVLHEANKVLKNMMKDGARKMTSDPVLKKLYEEGRDRAEWYENLKDYLRKEFGADADILIDFLAATSPKNQTDANVTSMFKAYERWMRGDPFEGIIEDAIFSAKGKEAKQLSFLGLHRRFLNAIKSGDPWGSQKVRNFRLSMHRDPYAVTVDLWMMRAFGFDKDSPTRDQYHFVAERVRKLAAEMGLTPRQLQAGIWFGIRRRKQTRKLDEKAFDESIRETLENPEKLRRFIQLQRQRMQVSWETQPSSTADPAVYEGLRAAPYDVQLDYHRKMGMVFLDADGYHRVWKELGVDNVAEVEGAGYWGGEVSGPAYQSVILTPKGITPDLMRKLETGAAVLGRVLRQDGVGWTRPEHRDADNSAQMLVDRPLTRAESDAFFAELHKRAGNDLIPIMKDDGIVFLNFTDLTAEQAGRIIGEVAKSHLPEDVRVGVETLWVESGLLENNWKENPNGEGYFQRASEAGFADLFRRLEADLLPKAERVREEFADRYGWGRDRRAESEPGLQTVGRERTDPGVVRTLQDAFREVTPYEQQMRAEWARQAGQVNIANLAWLPIDATLALGKWILEGPGRAVIRGFKQMTAATNRLFEVIRPIDELLGKGVKVPADKLDSMRSKLAEAISDYANKYHRAVLEGETGETLKGGAMTMLHSMIRQFAYDPETLGEHTARREASAQLGQLMRRRVDEDMEAAFGTEKIGRTLEEGTALYEFSRAMEEGSKPLEHWSPEMKRAFETAKDALAYAAAQAVEAGLLDPAHVRENYFPHIPKWNRRRAIKELGRNREIAARLGMDRVREVQGQMRRSDLRSWRTISQKVLSQGVKIVQRAEPHFKARKVGEVDVKDYMLDPRVAVPLVVVRETQAAAWRRFFESAARDQSVAVDSIEQARNTFGYVPGSFIHLDPKVNPDFSVEKIGGLSGKYVHRDLWQTVTRVGTFQSDAMESVRLLTSMMKRALVTANPRSALRQDMSQFEVLAAIGVPAKMWTGKWIDWAREQIKGEGNWFMKVLEAGELGTEFALVDTVDAAREAVTGMDRAPEGRAGYYRVIRKLHDRLVDKSTRTGRIASAIEKQYAEADQIAKLIAYRYLVENPKLSEKQLERMFEESDAKDYPAFREEALHKDAVGRIRSLYNYKAMAPVWDNMSWFLWFMRFQGKMAESSWKYGLRERPLYTLAAGVLPYLMISELAGLLFGETDEDRKFKKFLAGEGSLSPLLSAYMIPLPFRDEQGRLTYLNMSSNHPLEFYMRRDPAASIASLATGGAATPFLSFAQQSAMPYPQPARMPSNPVLDLGYAIAKGTGQGGRVYDQSDTMLTKLGFSAIYALQQLAPEVSGIPIAGEVGRAGLQVATGAPTELKKRVGKHVERIALPGAAYGDVPGLPATGERRFRAPKAQVRELETIRLEDGGQRAQRMDEAELVEELRGLPRSERLGRIQEFAADVRERGLAPLQKRDVQRFLLHADLSGYARAIANEGAVIQLQAIRRWLDQGVLSARDAKDLLRVLRGSQAIARARYEIPMEEIRSTLRDLRQVRAAKRPARAESGPPRR